MASVCFYFQVHQPYRLRRYSVFSTDPFYFDNDANREILEKVANKCYRPTTSLLLDLIRKHEGRFRISFALTQTVLDQLEEWAPDVIETLQACGETGACEFVAETSHHSLSALFSPAEFREQVDSHRERIQNLFGQDPKVFRNTELIYSNRIAGLVTDMDRFSGMLCEGVDRLLGSRSPNYVYAPAGAGDFLPDAPLRLLLKNYKLSDDVAFRFGNREWSEWPLKAETFAKWINQINGDGYLCNLFMDYETFGEHQWADTGIFKFLEALPEKVFDVQSGENDFVTVSEALARNAPVGVYDAQDPISWADMERDLSAWLGNAMQENAAIELYRLEGAVKHRHQEGDEHILEDWRKLTTSDHLYYMCTKFWADGDVHKYFSPYDSPYDAYINFMNVLDNIRSRVGEA
ncbi:MAG: glycoside hydrolase family 57 protein [Phycisphaerales bacterium]|nr:glycoside hydrolase family 57 protein [Phycisphaerales bacterium]